MKCLLSRWAVIAGILAWEGAAGVAQSTTTSPAASQKSEPIASIHFAGLQQLSADGTGVIFKEIWDLPATSQFRNEALHKVAGAVAGLFVPKNGGTASCVALIRPLLDDLCSAESYAEVSQRTAESLDCALALKLDSARSQLWQSNCSQILSGWQWKSSGKVQDISFLGTNSWFVLRCLSGKEGVAAPITENPVFAKLQQGQRPVADAKEYWLQAKADLPRLGEQSNTKRWRELPKVDLTVIRRKDSLRSEAHLSFRNPVVTQLEEWQVPTELIRDPLISFTAWQGLRSWLQRQPLFQELGLPTLPNQLYCWGLSQTPFQLQAAVPVTSAKQAFDQVHQQWTPKFNRTFAEYAVGRIQQLSNRTELVWRGLPVLVPYLEPTTDHGRQYLHAGLFPVDASTNPAPAALFEQITTRTNLLYYDWEITQARLDQLRPLLQLAGVFLTVSPMGSNSTAFKWLDVIQPRLGNTITEIEATSPRELNLVRTSHLGLNGLELLTLANWVEGTNFPKLNLDLGFRPVVKLRRQREHR